MRGRAPVDFGALEELLVRFSELIVEQPRIKDMDVNPLLASADGIVELEGRVVLYPSEVAKDTLPRTSHSSLSGTIHQRDYSF